MPSYGSAGVRGDGSSANTGNQLGSRSSTRVAQNPGGNSSFSLGWGDPSNATKVVRQQPTYAPPAQGGASVFGTGGSGAGGYGGNYGAAPRGGGGFGNSYGGAAPAPGPAPGGYGGYPGGAPGGAPGGSYGGGAPGGAYGGGAPGGAYGAAPTNNFSSGDYLPQSLNTAPQFRGGGDALESMAGGPLTTSPMTRRRQQHNDFAALQPKPVSPKVARAAEASSRRVGIGYSPTHGGNDAFGARGRVSSNSYASGSSQNTGNVITDRSSTRVAQQPGGNSSLSLGWGGSGGGATHSNRRQQQQQQQQPPPQQQQQYSYPGGAQQQQGRYGASGSTAFGANPDRMRNSSNAFANGSNQNTGNYITDRSSTRIHAPPGGRSTFTFG